MQTFLFKASHLLGPFIPSPPSLTVESGPAVGGDVQQGLGQDSASLEALDEDVALPLGQFGAVFVRQERQVSEGGRPPAESAVHEEVLGGGDEPL